MNHKQIKATLDYLPHGFNKIYWSMGDTTYKEEVFLAIIKAQNIPQTDALKLQSKLFPKNRLLRQILKEEVVECMGCYGKGFLGVSFYGNIINE
jgi:hypothetical protein